MLQGKKKKKDLHCLGIWVDIENMNLILCDFWILSLSHESFIYTVFYRCHNWIESFKGVLSPEFPKVNSSWRVVTLLMWFHGCLTRSQILGIPIPRFNEICYFSSRFNVVFCHEHKSANYIAYTLAKHGVERSTSLEAFVM